MAYQFTQTGQELQNLIDRIYQLADEYDSATNYAVGDYCSHEGKLYKCTAATTGTFDASKWDDSIFVLDEVDGLDTRLTTAEGKITSLNTSLANYVSIVIIPVPCTMSAGAATSTVANYSVASYIPSGYKHIGTFGTATSSNECYFYQVTGSNGTVTVQVKRPSGSVTSATTFNTSIALICIRNI